MLRLYNSVTKKIDVIKIGNELVSAHNVNRLRGSMYICGPTVYSESHMGHAITYIRADLFRRIMKSIFNVELATVMNITDIDDKILSKTKTTTTTTDPASHPFNEVSEKYYRSFLKDMQLVRVKPADLTIRVSKQIPLIIHYIQKLERLGHAYIAESGDVHFRVKSLKNYVGRLDGRRDYEVESTLKEDPRDFVLWKRSKPSEPIWIYESNVKGTTVPGRPGWHVQCSAISNSVFGNKLDFHYGGKDLIFPHHYNEEACCCAYHALDTTKTLHVWSSCWLHSGHLIFREEKMSKSIGNVVGIKDFIDESSINALRLLCLVSNYRADVDYNPSFLDHLKALDHRLSSFASFLIEALDRASESLTQPDDTNLCASLPIQQTHDIILEGICDDLDFKRGLDAILELAKDVYGRAQNEIEPTDLVAAWNIFKEWCELFGFEYGPMKRESLEANSIVNLLSDYRQSIRKLVINEMREETNNSFLNKLLEECDEVRARLDVLGYIIRDRKTKVK